MTKDGKTQKPIVEVWGGSFGAGLGTNGFLLTWKGRVALERKIWIVASCDATRFGFLSLEKRSHCIGLILLTWLEQKPKRIVSDTRNKALPNPLQLNYKRKCPGYDCVAKLLNLKLKQILDDTRIHIYAIKLKDGSL